MRHALALRLGLWYGASFLVSAIALLVFTYLLLGRALAAQDHDVLESMLARYTAEFRTGGLIGLQRLMAADEGEGRHERLLVRVMDARTEVVYFAEPPGWGDFDLSVLDQPLARDSAWTMIAHPPDGTVLEVGTRRIGGGVTIQVGRSSHVRDDLLANFRARALQVMLLGALIAAAGGLALTYVGLAPLRALESTVRSILTTGRFDARVATTGTRDPLDELGSRVNEMLGRIQLLLSGMRGALDNVAHDLRTPLTRFRNVAEAALVSGDPAAVREGLARALEEADHVSATLTALMDISEAETGTMRLDLAPVQLSV
ncbi:MAG: HAMP domain-containing protein, partial [Acidobacteriota bacterium]|nr:HAMP domain-containing protein [Acidobacteriota bacterium]